MKKYVAGLLVGLLTTTASLAVVNPSGKTWNSGDKVICNNGVIEANFTGVCATGWSAGALPSAGDPIIAFSDILSAPRSGWSASSPTEGAVVSIWGRGFGSSRGANYVTVGGVDLTASTDYFEAWGETGAPVDMLQRISFQINDSVPLGAQTITVTVGGQTSNAVPITITEDDIFFLDSASAGTNAGTQENPWTSFSSFRAAMGPGDVAYVKGTWNTVQTTADHIIYFNSSTTDGTASAPISVVGWPDETNLIETWSLSNASQSCIVSYSDHMTFSNLNFQCKTTAINAQTDTAGIRAIGNRVGGMTTTPSGTGSITIKGDSSLVLGNYLYGATSGNALDHAIYVNGCMPNVGAQVGHNQIEDFDVNEGPLIVVNHQDSRCPTNVALASHHIYSNFVDCSVHPSRGIGIYDQSWDSGVDTAGEPDPTYVYNNIVYNCGQTTEPAMYQNSAHVEWYNNAVIGAVYRGLSVNHASRTISTTIKNNVFTMDSGDPVYFGTIPSKTIDKNAYFGGNAPPVEELNEITSDPQCVVNTNTANIDCGTATHDAGVTVTVVTKDYNEKQRAGVYDLGPVEESN